MTTWRLEWLRLTRSRRWIALVSVYLVFGLIGPVMAKYMAGLLEHVQSGITITVPPPQPKDGIVNYLSQVGQIGLIVVVAIAAGAMFALGTVGIALAALIVLSLVGTIGAVHDWLPSTLSGATVELLSTTQLSDYAASLLTAIAASVLLVAVAVARLGRREV